MGREHQVRAIMSRSKPKAMTPIDFTHLAEYEEEWVALDDKFKVVDHSTTLAELSKRMGSKFEDSSFFFVPSSRVGWAGTCLT